MTGVQTCALPSSIKALELFGIKVNKSEDKKGKFFIIENNSVWQLPETPTVPEGDWSNV